MTPKLVTATALGLALAFGATHAPAQQESEGAQESMAEKIEAADAPDTAETDPVNETAQNEIGGPPMGGQGSPVVLDLKRLSMDLYERGYRQGYIRGVMEAREDMAAQLGALMRGKASPADASDAGGRDRSAGSGASGGSGQDHDLDRISNEVAARPGGTIVILPEGMSPERFVERIASERDRSSGSDTGGN